MALSKENLQTILQSTLNQRDKKNRYDGFIDLLRILSLDELDICIRIINDPKNPVSKTFDTSGTFLEIIPLPATFTLPASSYPNSSSLPSFDTLPRTTVIRITMLSLRFDDYSSITASKDKSLYLYKISDEFTGLLIYKLPAPNVSPKSGFFKSPDDRRREIAVIKDVISHLLIDINQFELKTVSEMIVREVLNAMTKDDSIVAELITSLFAFGFEKILDLVVKSISGVVKEKLLDFLTSSNGTFSKLFINNGAGLLFDGNVVYDFLSNDDTFAESGMRKTLHTIVSKKFVDVDNVLKDAETFKNQKEIQQADELRNLLIDYVTMLEHGLQAISGRLDVVFKPDGNIDISSSAQGYELLTDYDLDALYMFVFGYDYKAVITKFIDDYNLNIKDIGLFQAVAPSLGSWTVGMKDYRLATWLIWKSRAYLVLADVPFSRKVLSVRVYHVIPKTIKAAALKKTQLTIEAYSSDFNGKWPIVFASTPPLIPIDNSYSIDARELSNLYSDYSPRDFVDYPNQKPAAASEKESK